MTDQEFWEAIYIAAIASGRTPEEAEHMAGEAVHHRDVAWKEP